MDFWKALTAISGILILIIAGFLVWNFLSEEEDTEILTSTDVLVEGKTIHTKPSYGAEVDCLKEAVNSGKAPHDYINYSCNVGFWGEPYIRGAEIQNYVKDDKIGAVYHYKCTCKFTYKE